MTTEAKFKHILIELMKSRSLSEINVTLLCQKAGCHRQTFYYHYQDIYDLLSAIFLNEDIPGLEKASTPKEVVDCFFNYSKKNFKFIQAVYSSAARELVDEFYYSKMLGRLVNVFQNYKPYSISNDAYRLLARRFSKLVSDEFGFIFKDASITVGDFSTNMRRFLDISLEVVLPALATAASKERPQKG